MDKHTILVVDDEPNIVSSLKRVLASEDREILSAYSAEEAWRLLQEKGEVEVIICDNKLPGASGVEFLSKVKTAHPHTVRILITGYPDLTSVAEAADKAGIWRYLLKPVEIEELKTLVNQAFGYYRVLKENQILFDIVCQQAEWLKVLREKYPEIVSREVEERKIIDIEWREASDTVRKFIEKYYLHKKGE
ncbi:MAG: response regulator [Candidatus Omnitrophica bacterium]|nr:response regulator [Candidatus Omnitrophota bacterium]